MNLAALFAPRSIALIGASSKNGSVGNDVLKNLKSCGFAGKIFPVNPKVKELYGLAVFSDISELREAVDLLILAIPAEKIPAVLRQAGRLQVKAAIVLSAGFKEVGKLALEEEVAKICREQDIALLGPNCLGLMNPSLSLNASFAPEMPAAGSVAFLSQSGALGAAVLDMATEKALGFSYFVSLGNKALLSELDFFRYFDADPSTRVICCYIESLDQAEEWLRLLREEKFETPIVVLKSGRTQAGSRAAHSHTGALNTGDVAYQALFDQTGVFRAETVEEMLDLASLFSIMSYPSRLIHNVALLTNAGGPAVLATDVFEAAGLPLAQLSEKSQVAFQTLLPKAASRANPVDILGDASAELYASALEILLADEAIDAVTVLITPQSMTDSLAIAQNIVALQQENKKPVVTILMGGKSVEAARQVLRLNHQAVFAYPEAAARALVQLQKFSQQLQRKFHPLPNFSDVRKAAVQEILQKLYQERRKNCSEWEARQILSAYNFSLVPATLWQPGNDFSQLENHKKYVIKILSPDILHKTEVAGVKVNLSATEVPVETEKMWQRIQAQQPSAKLEGILIAEMIDEGIEMILGAEKNPLGKMMMFGWGGIYVELLKDVQFRFFPITFEDSLAMFEKLKVYPLLTGFRGAEKVDLLPLLETMARLSQLLNDFPEIQELDMNPIKVSPKRSVILDARIVLE
jgi:acetyl coenzyme A synthetase (ADP forming)-like protein